MLQEELGWPEKLTHRPGSAHLLAGVDLYFDFDWKTVINHPKRAFRNGRRLALLVKQDCPEDRKPALLLTTLTDVDEGPRQSETHYVVVVKIDNYLKEGAADAAWTYFAQKFTSSGGLPSLHRYEQLVSSAEELDVLLERHLDAAALTRWLDRNDTRLEVLRSLVSTRTAEAAPTTPEDVAAAIETLEHVTPEICRSLTVVANRSDPESGVLEAIAGGVAESSYGRIATSRALAARVPDRLRDVGITAQLYRALLENPDSTETDLQEFIESYPWILGLEYVLVSPRRQVIRGAVDFLVQRHDGYHDFLELKGPNEDIVRTRGGERDNVPASASGYSLGPALGQALAQVQLYREVFTHAESSLELYGIRKSRYPRVVIVVGRAADLSDTEQLIFRQLNQSLHRIEIVPYDVLADRVEAQILNLEGLLASGRDDSHGEAGTKRGVAPDSALRAPQVNASALCAISFGTIGINDMTIRMVVTAIVVALTGPLPRAAAAQEVNPLSGQIAALKEATSLRCQFDRGGQTFEWREGMAMGMKTDKELVPVMFDQIDRRSGQAVRIVAVDPLRGDRWVENVDIFEFGWELRHEASATYGITFVAGVGDNRHMPIEHVGRFTGVSMTTIWSPVDEHSVLSHEWEYPAVFTQHMPLSADDLPSQHAGRCWIER